MTPLREAFVAAGLDWIAADLAAPANVRGFVTTRNGGVSRGARASLDLGPAHPGTLDAATRADILENRRRVAAFLPAPPVWLEQVHGADVVTIDAANVVALRARPPEADAAVTRLSGVPLAVRVADCLPVILADDGGCVVGVAHAGWRGLAAGVVEATLARMDVPAANVVAWLGPAIGPRAFEVGDDVREAFLATAPDDAARFAPMRAGKWLADLPALARARLARAGVSRVTDAAACTFSDPARFYSYRRDRTLGRLAAFAWR